MTNFKKIEKAMHDARVKYSDSEHDIVVSDVEYAAYGTYKSVSISCSVYENMELAVFINVLKWNDEKQYKLTISHGDGVEYTYYFNSANDVANAVYLILKTATL